MSNLVVEDFLSLKRWQSKIVNENLRVIQNIGITFYLKVQEKIELIMIGPRDLVKWVFAMIENKSLWFHVGSRSWKNSKMLWNKQIRLSIIMEPKVFNWLSRNKIRAKGLK